MTLKNYFRWSDSIVSFPPKSLPTCSQVGRAGECCTRLRPRPPHITTRLQNHRSCAPPGDQLNRTPTTKDIRTKPCWDCKNEWIKHPCLRNTFLSHLRMRCSGAARSLRPTRRGSNTDSVLRADGAQWWTHKVHCTILLPMFVIFRNTSKREEKMKTETSKEKLMGQAQGQGSTLQCCSLLLFLT